MLCWGLSTYDSCDCGDHITSGRSPTYRPPEGINGLIDLDDETRSWLENNALDTLVVRDGTRKKKKSSPIIQLTQHFSERGSHCKQIIVNYNNNNIVYFEHNSTTTR